MPKTPTPKGYALAADLIVMLNLDVAALPDFMETARVKAAQRPEDDTPPPRRVYTPAERADAEEVVDLITANQVPFELMKQVLAARWAAAAEEKQRPGFW